MAVVCSLYNTYTLDNEGRVWSLGNINYLGLEIKEQDHDYTVPLCLGLRDIVGISSGSMHVACVDSSGRVWTFGNNKFGKLGVGGFSQTILPQLVSCLQNIRMVQCGWDFMIFVDANNEVFGCGSNSDGQLSLEGSVFPTPRKIPGLTNIKDVACGNNHSVFLDFDGNVLVNGTGRFGQLGLGAVEHVSLPTRVPSLVGVTQIASGLFHVLVLNSDGELWGFGNNSSGHLGLGDCKNRSEPEKIAFPHHHIYSISCGYQHSLVLTTDGILYGCGANGYQQLNSPISFMWSFTEMKIGISKVAMMSKGGYQTIIKNSEGHIISVGNSKNGDLINPLKGGNVGAKYCYVIGDPIRFNSKSARK